MRVVFLNSMEKHTNGDLVSSAQVWIGEEQGVWRIGWDTADEHSEEPLWYEGDSWSEMLLVYRHRLASKLADGFRPVIDGIFHEHDSLRNRSSAAQRLLCYGELHSDETLYQELCSWRRRRALAEHKAPYLVASNRLLRMISTYVPKTLTELMQLPGVGEGKSAEYGDDILALTENVDRSHNFPLDWVETSLDSDIFQSWIYKQKEAKYRQEMERFGNRRIILEAVTEGMNLEQASAKVGLDRREILELIEELEKEGHNVETLIEQELKTVPEAEQATIWAAYDKLGDAFLKPILQDVYGAEGATSDTGKLEQLYERLRLIRLRYRRQTAQGVKNAG